MTRLTSGPASGRRARKVRQGFFKQPDGGRAFDRNHQQAGVVRGLVRGDPPAAGCALHGPGRSAAEQGDPALSQIGQQGGHEGVHPAAQAGDGGAGLLKPGGLVRRRRAGAGCRGRRACAGGSPALGRDGGGEGTVLADAGPQSGGHHVDVEH